jgi:hypothetical protein
LAIEPLATPLFFNDHIRDLIDTLIARKTFFTLETLAAAAYDIALFALA